VAAGAPAIQIDEPLILHQPTDMRVLRALLEPVYDAAGEAATMIVATYGTDAAPLYAQLNSLPGDFIAVDCAGRATLAAVIAETGAGKPLALGIVDGRAPSVEGIDDLTRLVERCLHRYIHPEVLLQPSCGLAALSPGEASAKLAALVRVRDALQSTAPIDARARA
jgi:methionine synthase II (cobalamin-independent)